MKVLIIAGAGTSVELGVPGMVGFAEEFIEHTRQWNIEPDIVQRILGANLDVEHLIEELDRICSARGALESIGKAPGEFEQFDKLRAEIEWFIQHAAERVLPRDAHLMWGSVLRATARTKITFVTTNYDRAIELAANAEGIEIDDGFKAFDHREVATWRGFEGGEDNIVLVKLHGSTDWYSDSETGAPTKLRHPMPLFGRAALRIPDGSELGSALILPSREKLLTRDPYPRLSQAFLNAADACDIAIVIGSSLRDAHLRGAAQSIAKRVPLFLVNPSGNSCGVDAGVPIAQSASTFLIGTFPRAIASKNVCDFLLEISGRRSAQSGRCLAALRTALDPDEKTEKRCDALDNLESQGTSLDGVWLRQLLCSKNSHVARYALGLIPHRSFLDLARESPHASEAGAYYEDLALLEEMLSE